MSQVWTQPGIRKHVLRGIAAAFVLLSLYALVLGLVQGPAHLWEQSARLWYWIVLLAAGFGVQIGLFSFLMQALRERRKSAAAGAGTSAGISAGSMIACCAHHVAEALPALGISGAAAFLADYQVFFIVVGILANLVGVTWMLETIQRLGLCPILARWRGNMRMVKRAVTATAIVLAPVAFWVVK